MKKLIIIMLAFFLLVVPVLSEDEKNEVYVANRNAGKAVALTFDDGPHPVYTPQILDILKKYDARATFFVIRKNAEQYP